MNHYCTYFDSNYATSGLALYRSLERHTDDFHLHVLCMDDTAYEVVSQLNLPQATPISLRELESFDEEVAETHNDRSLIEYYFTLTPALPLYLFDSIDADRVSYLGADLYFYSSPSTLQELVRGSSVAVHTHRFPAEAERRLERSGPYNADFVSFANDEIGRSCLEDWRRDCIEWCYDRVEGERFANQGYLRNWPDEYENTVVIDHPGVGLAEWNRDVHELRREDGDVLVDGEPLIFYHFSGLEQISKQWWKPPIDDLTPIERQDIYLPHIHERLAAQVTINAETTTTVTPGTVRRARIFHPTSLFVEPSLKDVALMCLNTWGLLKRTAKGNLIRVEPR